MKKLLLVSLFWIGLAGAANAAPVICSVLMLPNTTGNTGSTCMVNADPGFFISSLTLTGTDDYTGYQTGTGSNPTVSFAASLNQSTSVFTGVTYCNVTTNMGNSVPCAITVLPASTVTGLNLSTYSVNLFNAMNTVSGGTVTGDSIVLDLNFGETMIPTNTPEPSSLLMLSSGFLGLGFMKRKVWQA